MSKCFNIYCKGKNFNIGNLVITRLNPDLGIGRIIKKLEIPTSKRLDDEDTRILTKYKVIFPNKLLKTFHPIDLVHYVYRVNEKINSKKGLGIINSNDFFVKEGNLSYEVLFENGKLDQINETEIYSEYREPIDKLLDAHEIDPPELFLIKYWANLFYSYYTSYQIKCITNSRLSLMPHQINVAHRLSEEHFPRIILADEVGLGKTIEAGIYIKEMMARNLAERILIIVPASLVKQWQFEMENKFNIKFEIYDGKKIKEIKKIHNKVNNPFYFDNLILCSLQFARNPKYTELLAQISWDIVIFDEAHHLRRYLINSTTGSYRETRNFRLAKQLSQSSESLLLLTATPLQLHAFELYSLIELIHPEAFDNYSNFEHFRKNMPFINLLASNVDQIENLNTFELENTLKLLRNLEYVDPKSSDKNLIKTIKKSEFKAKLLKNIEKDHTLSKFLIRNRKKNVFPEEYLNKRIVNTIIVNPKQEELELYDEIRLYLAKIYNSSISNGNIGLGFVITTLQKLLTSSKYAILKSIKRRLGLIDNLEAFSEKNNKIREEDGFFEEFEEGIIDQDIDEDQGVKIDLSNQKKILSEFYQRLKALPYDTKAEKLLELTKRVYQQNSKEKVLIFTQFVDTLFFLKKQLEKKIPDVEVFTFYGGMDKEQKDQAVEKFRTNNKFSVLLSTEVGGEGRNFQFCRVLINYDLPWNPMKLEQRIGRLDRIGQESREIYIYNFFIENTIETDIVFALDKRINLFEESIGLLEPIIGKIEKEMKQIIFSESSGKKRKKLNEFYRSLDEEIKKAKEIEMQLDDLMIDRKSFQMEGLISSLASCHDVKLGNNELYLLMRYFFSLGNNHYGILTDINNTENKIQISEVLSKKLRYKFNNEYLGTFDIDIAKEKEEIDFFALGHPLINEILNYIISSKVLGNFTFLTIKKESIQKKGIFIKSKDLLYLFIYSRKFQGYISETQFSAILIDEDGKEYDQLLQFIFDIRNFPTLLNSLQTDFEQGDYDKVTAQKLLKESKNIIKRKTNIWKKEIKSLNEKIFNSEIQKKQKIYEHRNKVLNLRLNSQKEKLTQKKKRLPTQRQLQNIKNLDDEKRKEERRNEIKSLEEQIENIEKDIVKTEKQLDGLKFEHEDLQNDMKKRNLAKFYTNLYAFALIRFT
ncbi:MAG: SNF2-related protein [Promethearchaeota archaeon]